MCRGNTKMLENPRYWVDDWAIVRVVNRCSDHCWHHVVELTTMPDSVTLN